MAPTIVPSATSTMTPAYTPTPTLSPFALATIWSKNYPIPTPPYDFPTPFPPEPSHYFDDTYKYGGVTIVSENNLITLWINEWQEPAITITGKKGRIIVQGRDSLKIKDIFSGNPETPGFQYPASAKKLYDINNDGIDEIVISRHDGGNTSINGLHIYELSDPPLLISEFTYYNFYWFDDLNNDKKLELFLQEGYLSYFSFMPWNIGGFIPVTQIFSYDPNKGYISSSCKFKDYYKMPDKNFFQNLNPERDNDAAIAQVIANYVMIGNTEKAKEVAIENLDGEKEIAALKAIEGIHNSIKSDICP